MTLLNFLTNAYPVSVYEVRQANPNVSFLDEPTDEDLAPFGYINVHPTPQPSHDPRTQRIEGPTAALDAEGVYRQQWVVRDATDDEIAAYDEANPPPADWATFKGGLLINESVAQIMATARAAGREIAVTNLPVALEKATSGQPAEFAACWAVVVAAGAADPEALAALTAAAQDCHLPAEFVAALDPAPEPGLIRARDEQGRFIADDPATPQDEAWV
jgi:hypothetical protein